MSARILLAALFSVSASVAFANNDFGACNGEARYLLNQGGAITKITDVKQDRLKLKGVYTHQFGIVEMSYSPDWEKLMTSEQRAEAVAETLAYMDEETATVKDGKMYYLVVNRAIFPTLEPLYSDSDHPERTTKWRPFVMYEDRAACGWHPIDIAIFEEELPEGIRKQLK